MRTARGGWGTVLGAVDKTVSYFLSVVKWGARGESSWSEAGGRPPKPLVSIVGSFSSLFNLILFSYGIMRSV